MSLTVEQVAALIAAKSMTDLTLTMVVEQIVTEARAAALSEAADAIEAASPETDHGGNSRPHSFASDCAKCGGQRAARIVRNLANQPPP